MSQRKGLTMPEEPARAISAATALEDSERKVGGVVAPGSKTTDNNTDGRRSIEVPPLPKRDNRSFRGRRKTSDLTTVTSMRLYVETSEALDHHCYTREVRRQDVIEQALRLYFKAVGEDADRGET